MDRCLFLVHYKSHYRCIPIWKVSCSPNTYLSLSPTNRPTFQLSAQDLPIARCTHSTSSRTPSTSGYTPSTSGCTWEVHIIWKDGIFRTTYCITKIWRWDKKSQNSDHQLGSSWRVSSWGKLHLAGIVSDPKSHTRTPVHGGKVCGPQYHLKQRLCVNFIYVTRCFITYHYSLVLLKACQVRNSSEEKNPGRNERTKKQCDIINLPKVNVQ